MLYPSTNRIERKQPRRRPQPRANRPAAPTHEPRHAWQQRAALAFQEAERAAPGALQAELAERIALLTGHQLRPETIYTNPAERLAVANVDGLTFRLQRDDLVLLRPCVHCGVVQFESSAIVTLADLGYALTAWQPACPGCEPLDSGEWMFH